MLSLTDIERSLLNQPTLGGRVRALLTATNMTQAELASKVGTKQQSIAYICGIGGHEVTTSRFTIKIAEVFGVDSNWLATGEGNPIPVKTEIADRNLQAVPVYLGNDATVAFLTGGQAPQAGTVVTSLGTRGKTFAVRVPPEWAAHGVAPNDDLIFDGEATPRPGQTVLVMVDRSSILLGRYQRTAASAAQIASLTPDWPEVMQIAEGVAVVGVLIERRHYGALAA